MGINPNSANNAGILMDSYIGTKLDIVREVAQALPWLTTIKEDVESASVNFVQIQEMTTQNVGIHADIQATYGSMQEIAETADYIDEKQEEIEASMLSMAYNLIKTQSIVAKYHTFV